MLGSSSVATDTRCSRGSQGSLGLARLTQSSVAGTVILVVAVMNLPYTGPHDPPKPPSQAEVLAMMRRPAAVAFIAASLAANVGCLVALKLKRVTGNMAMLFMFLLACSILYST